MDGALWKHVPMKIVTLADPASRPSSRVLASSLIRHLPDWCHVFVLVADGSVASREGVRPVDAVLDLKLERAVLRHDLGELSALLLPRLLARTAEVIGAPVVHLPPSVWVLGSLEPVADALATSSVLFVPRAIADVPDDGLEPTPQQLAAAGRISELAMGTDGTAAAGAFLSWWSQQLERALGSLDGSLPGARPEDRPWLRRMLELAPARFAAAVLEDPGCNLSMWNLHLHSLTSGGGLLVDREQMLRFLDLAGFDPREPYRLSPIASRVRISRSPALRELCADYAEQLWAAGWEANDRSGDAGRRLPDGLLYDEALGDLHSCAVALGEDLGDVFSEQGARALSDWLEGPAPEGAAYGINRYVYRRLARERPDVLRAYPQLDGPDGRKCAAWCWAFGQRELGLPDRFMPPRMAARGGGPAEGPPQQAPAPIPSTVRLPAEAPSPGANAEGQDPFAGEAVRLTGYLSHALGLGAAARGYARALAAAGVATSTVSVPLHHLQLPVELDSGYGRHSFEDLVHEGGHGYELVAVNPDELPGLVERLGEDYFQGPRIGIWGWETNSIPKRWASAFELVDENWVYSRFMAENIGAVATVPVIALPPPVERPAEPPAPVRLGVPEDAFLFLFVFDYLSTVQRKNPVGLIEAFKRAFAPGEGPILLLKTINGPLRPLAEEQVLWAAHGRPDVHVVDRSLSAAERDGLMAACNCYVSLHRSEGFGLTLAESMAIGKPVIATGYSGNVDFMNVANSYLVDYEIGRVGAGCEIYPPDGEWAEPSVEHAAELMRRVYEQPEEATRLGAQAALDIERELSPATTGAHMRRRLQELTGRADRFVAVAADPGTAR